MSLPILNRLTFWVAKAGNAPEEYEDAFECNPALARFAIADDASESSFAAQWAGILVRALSADPLSFDCIGRGIEHWLKPLQLEWEQGINWEQLPWFAEEKARAGAFSTLLGLCFDTSDSENTNTTTSGSSWRAVAVGDSCLFQMRNDNLTTAFPIKQPEDFGNRPVLLSTNDRSNRVVLDRLRLTAGIYELNDLFLLTTDALAHWFLEQCRQELKPWSELSAIREQVDFEKFITGLRQRGQIGNDDTTLISITVLPISEGNKNSC